MFAGVLLSVAMVRLSLSQPLRSKKDWFVRVAFKEKIGGETKTLLNVVLVHTKKDLVSSLPGTILNGRTDSVLFTSDWFEFDRNSIKRAWIEDVPEVALFHIPGGKHKHMKNGKFILLCGQTSQHSVILNEINPRFAQILVKLGDAKRKVEVAEASKRISEYNIGKSTKTIVDDQIGLSNKLRRSQQFDPLGDLPRGDNEQH